MSENLLLFLISSSFFINIFPLLYIYLSASALSDDEKDKLKIPHELLYIGIPIATGILFPIIYNSLNFIPRKLNGFYLKFNLSGALSALIISVVLDNVFNIHETLFEADNPFVFHAQIFVCYVILYQVVGIWVYKKIAGYFADRYSPPKVHSPLSPTRSSRSTPSSPPESISSKASVDSKSSNVSDASSRSAEILKKYSTPSRK